MIMNFIRNDDGATAIEYAVIAAMISVGIIAAVQLLGDALSDTYSTTASKVSASVN